MSRDLKYCLVFVNQVPTDIEVQVRAHRKLGKVIITDWGEEDRIEFDLLLSEGGGTMPQKMFIVWLTYRFLETTQPEEEEVQEEPEATGQSLRLEDLPEQVFEAIERFYVSIGMKAPDDADTSRLREVLNDIGRKQRRSRMVYEAGRTVRKAIRTGARALGEEFDQLGKDIFGNNDRDRDDR